MDTLYHKIQNLQVLLLRSGQHHDQRHTFTSCFVDSAITDVVVVSTAVSDIAIRESAHVTGCLFSVSGGGNCDAWSTSKPEIYADIVVNGR